MSVKAGHKTVSTKAMKQLPVTMRKKIKVVDVKRKDAPQAPGKGIAALAPATTSAPTPTPTLVVDTMMDAEILINHIGLKQAHALYQELGKYFKG